jgi:hypothetical protein
MYTRRTLLATAAGGTTAVLAGCLGGDDDSEDGTDDSSPESGNDSENSGEGGSAQFLVSTDAPERIEAGESVTLSLEVENAGDGEGTQMVETDVNGPGLSTSYVSERVTLGPGETVQSQNEYEADEAGEMEFITRTADDEERLTVTVEPRPAPSFEITTFALPEQIPGGEEVSITWEVQNTGDGAGTSRVALLVDENTEDDTNYTEDPDGNPIISRGEGAVAETEVTLDPGESKQGELRYTTEDVFGFRRFRLITEDTENTTGAVDDVVSKTETIQGRPDEFD